MLFALCAAFAAGGCASTGVESFASPDEAMQAVADVIGTNDRVRIAEIFGKDSVDLLESGDEVADREDAQKVREYIREKVEFEDHGDRTKVALLGREGWPFPIPLVEDDGRWSFDTEAGIEEIANRRVGRNELSTIATLHEYVDAQREYHSETRDGVGPAYARRVISSDGKRDGLYWPTAEGDPESPLGPMVAAASLEGYEGKEGEPTAYHGYFYRTLEKQGKNAPGGERSYLDEKGRMTRGFALLAWPAKYGNSGVMSFVVGPQGIVYQRDLGEDTEAAAAKIVAFDPDDAWEPTGD